MAEEEKDSVEDLKNKLYSRKEAPIVNPDVRTPLSRTQGHVDSNWDSAADQEPKRAPFFGSQLRPVFAEERKGMSLPTKFFIGSVIFFVAAAALATYMFFLGGNSISPNNIDLSIVAPSLVDGGKEATLSVLVDNRNTAPLNLVDLEITYPDGTRDPANPTQAFTHDQQSLGTITPGEQVKRDLNAIFYGQEGVAQTVSVTLQYSVPGSNAIFEKEASANITVGSSPVSLSVNAPSEAITGQQFPVDVVVQSNATTPVDNVVVEGQYPFGFTVVSSDPPAQAGNTLWRLGTMTPGASQTIHLMATINGQDGDQRVLTFLAGQDADQTDTQISVPFLSVPTTLTVQKPFITASIALNGQSGSTLSVPAGQPVAGTITWQNNLTDPVSNVQITLSLSGAMLDPTSIKSTDGFYQSSNNTVTWSQDQDQTLAQVAPGGTGTLSFSFATLPPGSGGTVYTNPTLSLNVNVTGTRQGESNVPESVSSAASAQVSVASLVSLAATATHFTGGQFANSGPMPPIVGQNTTYTIAWTVKNSSNTIGNATVSATLPSYVNFVEGQSGITYNSASRTVTWSIGDLPAGSGYSSAATSASFQVSLLPSSSQEGQSPALSGQASLTGTDRFAQVPVSATADAPTTMLTGDSNFNAGQGVVSPN